MCFWNRNCLHVKRLYYLIRIIDLINIFDTVGFLCIEYHDSRRVMGNNSYITTIILVAKGLFVFLIV